jgi:hypothetical protein
MINQSMQVIPGMCVCARARNRKRCSLDLIGAVALQTRKCVYYIFGTPCPFSLLVALFLVVTSVQRYSEFHNCFASNAVN